MFDKICVLVYLPYSENRYFGIKLLNKNLLICFYIASLSEKLIKPVKCYQIPAYIHRLNWLRSNLLHCFGRLN